MMVNAQGQLQQNNASVSSKNVSSKLDPLTTDIVPTASNQYLTLERIFSSDDFKEERISAIKWTKNGNDYFTLKENNDGQDLVRIDPVHKTEEIVVPASLFIPKGASKSLAINDYEFSQDKSKLLIYTKSRRVWRQNTRGDYWVLDLSQKNLHQLGGSAAPPSSLMFAKFSPTGSHAAYVLNNNIYLEHLQTHEIIPLTTDGSTNLIYGTSDWVNEEELMIRDAYRWSPDGKCIAFWCFDTSNVEQFHLIDNTIGTYPKITTFAYPKVGKLNSSTRIGVINTSTKITNFLNIPGDPREHYIPQMEWSPDGKSILLQQMNRLQNTNRVMLVDMSNLKIQTILTETDPTWLENENPVRWVNQGKHFIWLSERSGWRHAYLASIDGKDFKPITQGDFDVLSIEKIDELHGQLYFAASPQNPTQRYLYKVPLTGGNMELVTPPDLPGWHSYEFSYDATLAIHRYSTLTTPPSVELINLNNHQLLTTLADNAKLKKNLALLQSPVSEFFKVDIGNGLLLDAHAIKPPACQPGKKYPLIIYVYGEPHGQTVKDSWQGSKGLWHMMLAQQGYIVASVDNRGTNTPRGREWRKCVYRKIGIIAPEEQAAAVRGLLKRWDFADSNRVGVWGWSGGGSMSLNAIFRYPELYHTAIAVAPNADQLLYDTIYQERYMGLPEDNAEGYRLGSPLTYAEQLQGNLLLVHGTGDDNGHYQGTEKLINKLIAHNKQFSVMPYPARTHSISEGENTVLHFHTLLTNYFHTHLPADHETKSP